MLATGTENGELLVWDTVSWSLLKRTKNIKMKSAVLAIAWSPDNQYVAFGSGMHVLIYDLELGSGLNYVRGRETII